jgi:hypothetical protein
VHLAECARRRSRLDDDFYWSLFSWAQHARQRASRHLIDTLTARTLRMSAQPNSIAPRCFAALRDGPATTSEIAAEVGIRSHSAGNYYFALGRATNRAKTTLDSRAFGTCKIPASTWNGLRSRAITPRRVSAHPSPTRFTKPIARKRSITWGVTAFSSQRNNGRRFRRECSAKYSNGSSRVLVTAAGYAPVSWRRYR